MVLRQYCEDWAGNVYLFAVNRRRSALDIRLPAADGAPICSFAASCWTPTCRCLRSEEG